MGKWVTVIAFSCGMVTNAWASMNVTAHDEIANWSYALLNDDITGELTSDAYVTDLAGRGFMSIGCAPITAGKPAVFIIISSREALGLEGEPGRITYRVGKQPAVKSAATFRKAVRKGQLATYILIEIPKELPRMLRNMTQGPSMEVELSPKVPALTVNLRFPIGDVRPLYRRMEKDCPGFLKTF